MSPEQIKRIVDASVADAMNKHYLRQAGVTLAADERAAFNRSVRQVQGMKPGQSRAAPTLEAHYAASNAMPGAGRINQG